MGMNCPTCKEEMEDDGRSKRSRCFNYGRPVYKDCKHKGKPWHNKKLDTDKHNYVCDTCGEQFEKYPEDHPEICKTEPYWEKRTREILGKSRILSKLMEQGIWLEWR